MTLTIGLPVKGYIKHYVLFKQNLPIPDSTIDLSATGEIPLILRSLLQGKLQGEPYRQDPVPEIYDGTIVLVIPQWQATKTKIVITQEGVHLANQFLLSSFQEWMVERVLNAMKHGVTEHDTIYQIINELGIDDLISYDALKKASYRLRMKKKMPAFRQVVTR
jgi:hypothetical protein